MQISNTEKTGVIIMSTLIAVLVILGALIKLEHWSETTQNILFATGLSLSAVLSICIVLITRSNNRQN